MGLTLCPEGVSSSSITMRGPKINTSSTRWNMFTSRSLFLKQLGSVRSGLTSVLSRLDTTDWLREQRATCFHDGRKPIPCYDKGQEQREQSQFNSEFTELVLNTSHMNAINFENLKFTAQKIRPVTKVGENSKVTFSGRRKPGVNIQSGH